MKASEAHKRRISKLDGIWYKLNQQFRYDTEIYVRSRLENQIFEQVTIRVWMPIFRGVAKNESLPAKTRNGR